MNSKNVMIIIDNKIVTKNIAYYQYNKQNNTYLIKYKNSNRYYNYLEERVNIVTDSTLLDINEYYFFLNNVILKNIKQIYEFFYNGQYYYRVILENNTFDEYSDTELKKINKDYDNILRYMKKIAEITSISTKEGKKILCEQMEKVEIGDLNSALANYFQLSDVLTKESNIDCLIFPFGCNSSQYEAVENAIYNKISVIEGPPGTGKTQTILNIMANIIVRNMNCQIVSNNNAAIENIEEKLRKYNLDFFEALLGKRENKDVFVENQKEKVPTFDEYKNININDLSDNLKNNNRIIRKIYKTKKEIANLTQEKNELSLEYKYFEEMIREQNIELKVIGRYNAKKLKVMWNEIVSMNNLSVFDKLKYIFIYQIANFKFYKNDMKTIIASVQNQIYINELIELENSINEKEKFIEINQKYEENFIESSMIYLKKYLSLKYKKGRKKYFSYEIRNDCKSFLNDYPVILSTTYSSRNTFIKEFKFDYIIMDESSQIDVVTGTLALSSAKYAVIIGDEKQLPNVITNKVKEKVDSIFNEFNLNKGYSYSLNSFLSSVKNIIPNVQKKMLEEHYRCHPKIINFCNKKFYNNKLAIMTEDNGESDVIKVIKTKKGNHSRENSSQRQVDIIKCIISDLKSNDIGIIAPYKNQVELIQNEIKNVEVSTVHKFQGREKDVIIISTVDDDITDFVSNANILNVAISRAKKQLLFIVTGNEIKNRNINDFIDYVDYNNMEIANSKIGSVFDLLYKQNEIERLNFYKNHNKVSKFDSENLIYYLIKRVIKDYDGLDFIFLQPMSLLIKDKSLLDEREKKYASHPNTHVDFLIFKIIGKKAVLAIEVDGYKNHKKGTKQYERDQLKNVILEKYNIPLIRLATNGSGEEKNIRDALDKIINVNKKN